MRTLSILFVLCLASTAQAVPLLLQQQGRLLDSADQPVTGTRSVVFSLWDDDTLGNLLWTETISVGFDNGYFSVILGQTNPVTETELENAEVFLGLSIAGEELLPRQRVVSAPYAVMAGTAENVVGGVVDATSISVGGNPIVDSGGVWVGPPVADTLSGLTCNTGDVPQRTAGGWVCVASSTFATTSLDWTAINNRPAGLDDGDGDALAALTCADGSVVKRTAGGWACGADGFTAVQGQSCAGGSFVSGFNGSGTMTCTTPSVSELSLPANGLNEISNNLLLSQFVQNSFSATTPVGIPDGNMVGVTDSITVPNVGLAESLYVCVNITNSNMQAVVVTLRDPDGTQYILQDVGTGSGTSLATCYPAPSVPITGDLGAWVGANPTGTWQLRVVDGQFTAGGMDGAIVSWNVTFEYLSTSKVEATGNLIVDGNLGIGAASPTAKLQIAGGDAYIANAANGLVLKAPGGQCYRVTVQDGGALLTSAITCP
jgi:subtilisin-like proprotein convertase family protein